MPKWALPKSPDGDPAPRHAIGESNAWGIEIAWESDSFSLRPFQLFRLGKVPAVSRPHF
ncbi:hypothetical protein RISK_004795 [Rhodopirellula islandica]|uniref:Uncharacterized protein n=1 Tax=Rhodopirellula islandica TaxID=595434 RepID=A0A0J1B9K4_RHOIS|nr:hypothetical protein RISK_004795 [Rhodopirellula islandica]